MGLVFCQITHAFLELGIKFKITEICDFIHDFYKCQTAQAGLKFLLTQLASKLIQLLPYNFAWFVVNGLLSETFTATMPCNIIRFMNLPPRCVYQFMHMYNVYLITVVYENLLV